MSVRMSATPPDHPTGRPRRSGQLRRRSLARSICTTGTKCSKEPAATSPASRPATIIVTVADLARHRGRHIVSEHNRRHCDNLVGIDRHGELFGAGRVLRHFTRPHRLCTRPLAALRDRRLRLELRPIHPHAAYRVRPAAGAAGPSGNVVYGAPRRRRGWHRRRNGADVELGGTARISVHGLRARAAWLSGRRAAVRFRSRVAELARRRRLSARPRRHRSRYSHQRSVCARPRPVRLHGQTTFIEQYALPFRSPYRGPNSLDPNSGRESWDVMFFVGANCGKAPSSGSIRRSIRASG